MSEAMREMTLDEYVGKLGHHLANRELIALRAELAELRARVPAICFPRQPNGEGGWVIDANYVAAIHKDCFPIDEWQPCEEEVEAVLLAVERAAPVTPATVVLQLQSGEGEE